MATKKYDLTIVIGRFQPLHDGHIQMFNAAAQCSDNILVLFGSSKQAQNIKNPFNDAQRRAMFDMAITAEDLPKANYFFGNLVDDLYDNGYWIRQVLKNVAQVLEKSGKTIDESRIAIVGHRKADVIYLDWFPTFELVEVDNYKEINATDIRDLIYSAINYPETVNGLDVNRKLEASLPKSVLFFLGKNKMALAERAEDVLFIEKYQAPFKDLPHPPVFVTVDCVVISRGHVLLIKRKAKPGKGLYALPGGFLDPNETPEEGIVRELYEETGLKVKVGDIQLVRTFGHPKRSQRGRTVTVCGYIHLPDEIDGVNETRIIEGVTGSAEVEKIIWPTIQAFGQMSDRMFEDHWSIGRHMIRQGILNV